MALEQISARTIIIMHVEGTKRFNYIFSHISPEYQIWLGNGRMMTLDPRDPAASDAAFISHSYKANAEFKKFARNGEEMIRGEDARDHPGRRRTHRGSWLL